MHGIHIIYIYIYKKIFVEALFPCSYMIWYEEIKDSKNTWAPPRVLINDQDSSHGFHSCTSTDQTSDIQILKKKKQTSLIWQLLKMIYSSSRSQETKKIHGTCYFCLHYSRLPAHETYKSNDAAPFIFRWVLINHSNDQRSSRWWTEAQVDNICLVWIRERKRSEWYILLTTGIWVWCSYYIFQNKKEKVTYEVVSSERKSLPQSQYRPGAEPVLSCSVKSHPANGSQFWAHNSDKYCRSQSFSYIQANEWSFKFQQMMLIFSSFWLMDRPNET